MCHAPEVCGVGDSENHCLMAHEIADGFKIGNEI